MTVNFLNPKIFSHFSQATAKIIILVLNVSIDRKATYKSKMTPDF
jgi:hypothetical protein